MTAKTIEVVPIVVRNGDTLNTEMDHRDALNNFLFEPLMEALLSIESAKQLE